jgi:hypothetical protein
MLAKRASTCRVTNGRNFGRHASQQQCRNPFQP